MSSLCSQVVEKGVDTLHLTLDAKNHPDMPIVGYKVEFKEEGHDWSQAKIAEFNKGLSLNTEDKLVKLGKSKEELRGRIHKPC